jgi:hypothetical protein
MPTTVVMGKTDAGVMVSVRKIDREAGLVAMMCRNLIYSLSHRALFNSYSHYTN